MTNPLKAPVAGKKLRVAIIDMQPITPAVGGGRQRLLGLYHALGENIEAIYLGSYDWPGEPYKDIQLTSGLREIVVPLSDAHHLAAKQAADKVGGKVVIDCLFSEQVVLSPAFLDEARRYIAEADVVVFSHPWAFPPLEADLAPNQLVVYDSQNVEVLLRTQLFSPTSAAEDVLRTVAAAEYGLCRRADLVLACSHADREIFSRIYDLSFAKIRVVPNGIFAFEGTIPTIEEREQAKAELGVAGQQLCIFIGSNYEPNNEAARFIALKLATSLPSVRFVIVGGCASALADTTVADNVEVVGVVDENSKRHWLRAADVALNPLSRGSGTSIKMFDFMAAGVPVLTTRAGARGIAITGNPSYRLAPLDRSELALRDLLRDSGGREELARHARSLVEAVYAWERISPRVGRLFESFHRARQGHLPEVSVVIPTYERPEHLDRLFACLEAQESKDFEVIVIDQSKLPWAGRGRSWPFALTYVHTPVRGAVKARNAGGELATGRIIAFTDDDCEPRKEWIANAIELFRQSEIVGVEGRIESDHMNDPEWRPVSNVEFKGLGFMTANLLVRNEVFQRLDGFDLRFDEPHFREDTDFGWRMKELGSVPYADNVVVFHPAHRRDVQRESSAERNKFFEKDALLFKKHPEQYLELLVAEGHWHGTPGFWDYFDHGLRKYGVTPTQALLDFRDVHNPPFDA